MRLTRLVRIFWMLSMEKAKCPHCHADINRFFPEKIYVKKDNIPWYKPDLMNVSIVCSQCRKHIEYRIPSVTQLLPTLVFFIPLMHQMWKENPNGLYVYLAILTICFSVMYLRQIYAVDIYKLSKNQD